MQVMTQEVAEQIIHLVDRVPKQKGHGWECQRIEMTPHAEAIAHCTFNRSTPRVQEWFKDAGANAYRIEKVMDGNWKVWFEPLPISEKAY